MDVRATRWIGWTLLVCTGCVTSEKQQQPAVSTPNFKQLPDAKSPAQAAAKAEAAPPIAPPVANAPPKNAIQQAVAYVTPAPAPQTVTTPVAPPPAPPAAHAKKSTETIDGKRAFTVDSILSFAKMKEQEAQTIKDNPERRMQLRDMARVDLQEVLRRDPRNRDAYLLLTRVYTKMRDFPKAEETIQKGLAIFPRDADLWAEKGLTHKDAKNFDEAVRSFEQALVCQPENREMMKKLGYTLGLMGRMDEAFNVLQRSVGAAQAHYRIAQLHEMREESQLARRRCLMALQEQANLHAAQEMLIRLGGGPQPTNTAPSAGQ